MRINSLVDLAMVGCRMFYLACSGACDEQDDETLVCVGEARLVVRHMFGLSLYICIDLRAKLACSIENAELGTLFDEPALCA